MLCFNFTNDCAKAQANESLSENFHSIKNTEMYYGCTQHRYTYKNITKILQLRFLDFDENFQPI